MKRWCWRSENRTTKINYSLLITKLFRLLVQCFRAAWLEWFHVILGRFLQALHTWILEDYHIVLGGSLQTPSDWMETALFRSLHRHSMAFKSWVSWNPQGLLEICPEAIPASVSVFFKDLFVFGCIHPYLNSCPLLMMAATTMLQVWH